MKEQEAKRLLMKHAEFVMLAAVVLRGYGYNDLADEAVRVAGEIRSNKLATTEK